MTVASLYPRPSYIYVLIDPRTQAIRYVGKTVQPYQRYRGHCAPSNQAHLSHKNTWLIGLRALGLRPIMQIVETVDERTDAQAERWWIARLRADGVRLTNLTAGGEGASGVVVSAATRLKLSAVLKGRDLAPPYEYTPEIRAKLSRSHRGLKHTAEAKAKIAAAQRGHKRSPEELAKQSARQKGKPLSAEHRAHIGAGLVGKTPSPETVARRRATRLANDRRRREEQGQLCLFTNPTPDS